ncbi:hypothetical protein PR202_gb28429 [Eleusine coracana subsp. coracana]|uniref:Secreted protein n=1 Tax=Eleusine coracana subsp. coracana TaxID=191504 RepID=A0AAV5FWS9_ELECO|nr:hypothetical protein PR202_gb28429 [Eleusine coracana subsp. coracana]
MAKSGRLILVKSVLAAIPIYSLMADNLPSWALKQIEAIQRRFCQFGVNAQSPAHRANSCKEAGSEGTHHQGASFVYWKERSSGSCHADRFNHSRPQPQHWP